MYPTHQQIEATRAHTADDSAQDEAAKLIGVMAQDFEMAKSDMREEATRMIAHMQSLIARLDANKPAVHGNTGGVLNHRPGEIERAAARYDLLLRYAVRAERIANAITPPTLVVENAPPPSINHGCEVVTCGYPVDSANLCETHRTAWIAKMAEAEEIANRSYEKWQPESNRRQTILIGDWVVELTSLINRTPAIERLGQVVSMNKVRGSATDYDYVIKNLLGNEIRWANCKMIPAIMTNGIEPTHAGRRRF